MAHSHTVARLVTQVLFISATPDNNPSIATAGPVRQTQPLTESARSTRLIYQAALRRQTSPDCHNPIRDHWTETRLACGAISASFHVRVRTAECAGYSSITQPSEAAGPNSNSAHGRLGQEKSSLPTPAPACNPPDPNHGPWSRAGEMTREWSSTLTPTLLANGCRCRQVCHRPNRLSRRAMSHNLME